MAFGTGSAMAHIVVDAVMGPRTIQHETAVSEAAISAQAAPSTNTDSCNIPSKAFQDVCF
jgi:coiled-coil-helix-coiled-coil-helix domain-containing protein 10